MNKYIFFLLYNIYITFIYIRERRRRRICKGKVSENEKGLERRNNKKKLLKLCYIKFIRNE